MITASALGLSGPIGTRPVTSRDLLWWTRRIRRAADRGRRETRLCLLAGVAIDAVAVGLILGVAAVCLGSRHLPYAAGSLAVGGAVCGLMLLVALAIKPAGRAEAASTLVDDGFAQACRSGHPAVGGGAVLVLVVALYGSFAVAEAIHRALARRRVFAADPFETARILAAVAASPAGVPVNALLKCGQSADALRRPVAALILDGWVVLRDRGRVVQQRSPADRRVGLRHPLADVFGL